MGIEQHSTSPLAEAVRRAGSQSAFARLIGKRQSTVSDWLRLDRPIPAELVITVERETGVSRHNLRPDIYPVDKQPPSLHVTTTLVRGGEGEAHFGRADKMKRGAA